MMLSGYRGHWQGFEGGDRDYFYGGRSLPGALTFYEIPITYVNVKVRYYQCGQ
ncbi:hypothetical protein GGQ73_003108 [Rhizobium skierniewicense]|uniref:Uncharacterized protein n=1 Tax=Rhizobium skierniewicense TaxID=984260 RepID=A0A7W6C7G1_9HYPH|nr:hypothetical protein [Rhizobium skierniewicense]